MGRVGWVQEFLTSAYIAEEVGAGLVILVPDTYQVTFKSGKLCQRAAGSGILAPSVPTCIVKFQMNYA